MVSTANSSSAENTGTNNNIYSQSIVRKPFIQVVQEWTATIDQKLKSKVFQNNSSDLPKLTAIEDERSFEELLVLMNDQETQSAKFFFACRNGSDVVSLQLLNQLIETCSSENSSFSKFSVGKMTDKDNSSCSLMHVCAQRNKPQCLELLLSLKMPVDVLDSLSSTPLHYAVAQNCHEAVVFLLNKGANINAKDSYSKFPLLIALKQKHYALAELLASFRPDVHLRVSKGNTVLHIMAGEGDITAVRLLVEKLNASPLRKNNEEENVLYNSLPHFEIVQYLAVQFASKGLDRLLCNTNTSGKNILHKCGVDGHIDNVLLLLKYMNLREFNQKQIESLLNTMDKKGDTPLLLAVKNSRKELVRFLVECTEVELNEGDSSGTTALQTAVNISDKDMINTLSKAGASLKPINRHDEESEQNNCFAFFRSMSTTLVLLLSFISIICIICMAAISLGFYGESIKRETQTQRDASFREVSDYLGSEISRHTVSSLSALSAFQTKLIDTSKSLDNAVDFSYNMIRSIYNSSDFTIDVYFGTHAGDLVGVVAYFNAPVDVFTMNATEAVFEHHTVPSLWDQSLSQILATGAVSYNNASEDDKFGIYYQAANNSLGPAWTLSYAQLSFPGALFVSFMTSVRDPVTKEMQLYMGSDISTEAMALFLEQKSIEWSSTIIVVERSTGYLISTSDPNFLVYSNDGQSIQRFDGSTGRNELIKATLSYSRQQFGHKLEKVKSKAYGLFEHQKRFYLLNIGELKDEYGLDWLIVQAVPRDLFFKDFKIAIGSMVGLTCVLLLVGVIISIGASLLFMAPLKRLSALAETIKLLQLEEVERKLKQEKSFFSEIRSLQSSFGSMSVRLKQFRQFIPEHILAVIETEVAHKEILKLETLSASIKKGSAKDSSLKKGEVELNTLSDTCSDTRISTVHANYHSKGLVTNALTSGLVSGTVSVMTIKFDDMSEILESYSSADVNESMKGLLTAIKDKVRESNAQLVSHTHSHAVIAWNTLITQSDHRNRAVRTALGCQKAILGLQEVWRMKGLPLLDIQIGLSSGPSFYGNIGSDATKIFTVIGRAATESKNACHLNDSWGTRILVSHDIYQAAKELYFLRPIDRITDELAIYELGEARNTDEWTQELSQDVAKENDVWFEYTRGFKCFDKRDYEQAFVIFSDYLAKYPYDVVAQKMVDKSRTMIPEL